MIGANEIALPSSANLPRNWGGTTIPTHGSTLTLQPFLPTTGLQPQEDLILVNGIMQDPILSSSRAQILANSASGARVLALHNTSDGFLKDIGQTLKDDFSAHSNPATRSLTKLIYRALRRGRPLHIVAHSQGAMIASNAVRLVAEQMRADGLSAEETKQRLSALKIETHAGAASSYEDGPQYVHYVNMADAVPNIMGVGSMFSALNPLIRPGEGAVIRRFAELNLPLAHADIPQESKQGFQRRVARAIDAATHGPEGIYFAERIPFEKARQGQEFNLFTFLRDLFLSALWLPINLFVEVFQWLLNLLTYFFREKSNTQLWLEASGGSKELSA